MVSTGYMTAMFSELKRLRSERRSQLLWLAALWLALPCISIFFLVAFADMLFAFSMYGRAVSLSLFVASLLTALFFLFRMTRRQLSMQAIASLVDKARPAAENRIINAVQFAESGAQSSEFIEALLSEKPFHLEQVEAKELYSPSYLHWLKRVFPIALLLWLIPLCFSPNGIAVSMLRIIMPFAGIAPYSHTLISEIAPGDTSVKRGQELEVFATLSGDLPEKAYMELDNGTDKVVRLDSQPDADGKVAFKTPPLFSTTRYRLSAGDAWSSWYKAKVAAVPGILKWEAKVSPPPHTHRDGYTISHDMEVMEVMPGSEMDFTGMATTELASVSFLQNGKVISSVEPKSKRFALKANIPGDGVALMRIVSMDGVEATLQMPITFLRDNSPSITLVDTPLSAKVERGKEFPIVFMAKDDFGVQRVGLEYIPIEAGGSEQISSATPEKEFTLDFKGRFVVDTGSFNIHLDGELRLRLWVEDNSPGGKRIYSPIVSIEFLDDVAKSEARTKQLEKSEDGLAQLIRRQKLNLKDTRQLADMALAKHELPSQRLEAVSNEQGALRVLAVQLLEHRDILGMIGDRLAGLVNNEMKEVMEQFSGVFRSAPSKQGEGLVKCTAIQNAILAALTGMKEGIKAEQAHLEKADIFALLQNIIKMQRGNLKDTQNLSSGKKIATSALIFNQDRIAQGVLSFSNACLEQAERRTTDEFSEQLKNARSMLTEAETYEKALSAAESLEDKDFKSAINSEKVVLKDLLGVLDVLNKWRVQNAKETLKSAFETIKDVKVKLDELEKKQATIAEVTRDMAKRGEFDDKVREKLAEMDREQKEMADDVEKLANDLYQFPDLPICNELNSKMREIFEDVLQALDSENSPSIEIAVQKEDAILDAIRNTKERIEDVESWLPDIPDNLVWNMESFDTDEFPEIPLVPLPDELEDLVGELLDQDSSIDALSQDPTGNNIVADAEMGWAVMDGPMPSFSAKGKTGNTRPNDNEMTGRSGAGREGQSTGELVENHVKGYEGRETHARKTNDKFQKGMVTEDEDSTFKTKATGGGKLGGESESQGMFGNAPRRDLHTAAHGSTPQKLRQETEALYASARLLFIGTGGLSDAAGEMRRLESEPPDIRTIGSLHKRIMRRLEDTQVSVSNGMVLSMPVSSVSQTGGAAVDESEFTKVSDEYKTILQDYYKGLAE